MQKQRPGSSTIVPFPSFIVATGLPSLTLQEGSYLSYFPLRPSTHLLTSNILPSEIFLLPPAAALDILILIEGRSGVKYPVFRGALSFKYF